MVTYYRELGPDEEIQEGDEAFVNGRWTPVGPHKSTFVAKEVFVEADGSPARFRRKTGESPRYPEHEKVKAVRDKSQVCGEFFEWLEEQGVEMSDFDGRVITVHAALHRYFDIDQKKLDDEKRQMLEGIRP